MIRREMLWLASAFVAGFFLVGLPHWAPAYDRGDLLDPAIISALAGLAAIAMMLVVGEVASPRWAWLTMTLCTPAAVLARVIVETMRDPTSHNLWPFEIVLACLMSGLAVTPGVLAGALSLRLKNRGRG